MTSAQADQVISLLTSLNGLFSTGVFPSLLWAVGFFIAFAHGFRAGSGGGSREL